jgi:hypothetical protein
MSVPVAIIFGLLTATFFLLGIGVPAKELD